MLNTENVSIHNAFQRFMQFLLKNSHLEVMNRIVRLSSWHTCYAGERQEKQIIPRTYSGGRNQILVRDEITM